MHFKNNKIMKTVILSGLKSKRVLHNVNIKYLIDICVD